MKQNSLIGNFEDIINKFNYNSELAVFLKKIYQEYVQEFGEEFEPIIYEAFLNTEIVSCNNIYTCLKERGMLYNEVGDSIVNVGDFNRATGVYSSYPEIIYDEKNGEFRIVGVKRLVAVANMDLSLGYIKGALVHELGHMVKSYYDEFRIEGNILIIRSGLIETQMLLSVVDNMVIKTRLKENGVGLEEGLTSLLEETICKRIISDDYNVKGYAVVNAIAKNFVVNEEEKRLIFNEQMLKNKASFISDFESFFGPYAYNKLEDIADRLYSLGLRKYSEIFEPEKMGITTQEINDIINNEYNPFILSIEEYTKNMKDRI